MQNTFEDGKTYPIEVRRKLWDNPKHPGWPINLDRRYIPIYKPLDFPVETAIGAQLLENRPVRMKEMEKDSPVELFEWLVKKQPDLVYLNLQPELPETDSDVWLRFKNNFVPKVRRYMTTLESSEWFRASKLVDHVEGIDPEATTKWRDLRNLYEDALINESLIVKTYYTPKPARLYAETDSWGGHTMLDRYIHLPIAIQLVDANQPKRILSLPTSTGRERLQRELADAFPHATGYQPWDHGQVIPAFDAFQGTLGRFEDSIRRTIQRQIGQTVTPTLPGVLWKEGFIWNKEWDFMVSHATFNWLHPKPERTEFGPSKDDIGLLYPTTMKIALP